MFRKDEVAGKIVVEASGKSLGKAKDIAFGLDGSVALIVAGDDNSEVQISMDRVAGVADYIVVRREQAQQAPKKPPAPAPTPAAAPAPAPAPATAIPPPPAARTVPVTPAPAMQPASLTCKSCGAPLRAGAKFCTKCGTPV